MISVTDVDDNRSLEVTVSDEGHGIPKETLDKILNSLG